MTIISTGEYACNGFTPSEPFPKRKNAAIAALDLEFIRDVPPVCCQEFRQVGSFASPVTILGKQTIRTVNPEPPGREQPSAYSFMISFSFVEARVLTFPSYFLVNSWVLSLQVSHSSSLRSLSFWD